jgi:hypothetical protein
MLLYSENGLTLLIERIGINVYLWLIYVSGDIRAIVDFDTVTGRHSYDAALRAGITAMDDYRRDVGAAAC